MLQALWVVGKFGAGVRISGCRASPQTPKVFCLQSPGLDRRRRYPGVARQFPSTLKVLRRGTAGISLFGRCRCAYCADGDFPRDLGKTGLWGGDDIGRRRCQIVRSHDCVATQFIGPDFPLLTSTRLDAGQERGWGLACSDCQVLALVDATLSALIGSVSAIPA